MGEWPSYKLNEVGRIVTGKTPPSKIADCFGGEIPFVTPTDMDSRKFISRTIRYLSETGKNTVKNCVIPKSAIMVSCIGSDMGKIAVAGYDCVTNQQINSIIVNDNFCPDFIYYNLFSRKEELQNLAHGGSTMPILNKGHFSSLILQAPPLPEQLAIARILGTLDDKIELNRRTNETLEAMARDIFKDWFIDFGPTRTKIEGREPYLAPDLWALFPDRLDDEGKPDRWETTPIAELIEIIGGGTPKTSVAEFWNGDIPWFSVVDAPSPSDVFVIDTEKHITESGVSSSSTRLLPVGAMREER